MKFLRRLSSFFILSLSIWASGQEILIVDEASEYPLEGVALYNKSKSNATITNENGVASLSFFSIGETVFVQYYGYKKRSFEMKNRSPNYPFQFAILDNVVQIKHEQVFVAASGAGDFDILGYNPDNNDKDDTEHKGKICYTSTNDAGEQFVSVQSNELGVTGSTTLRGYTLPVRNTGVQPSALFRCRSSVGTGVDAPAYMVNILNSMGSPMCTYSPGATCTRDTSEFRNAGRNDAGFSSIFPRISQAYYLLQSDNTIATTPENVRRILWIQYDPDNLISITENTIGLKLNFKTNNAMQMQIHQDGSDSFSRDEELMANQIHGGTIIGQIQVKTRRSRGQWR